MIPASFAMISVNTKAIFKSIDLAQVSVHIATSKDLTEHSRSELVVWDHLIVQ
jgi:hypothetical protein